MLKKTILNYFIIFLISFVLFSAHWLERKFGDVTFIQISYHLGSGKDGILTGDPDYISSFIRSVFLASLYVIIIVWFLECFFNVEKRNSLKKYWDEKISSPLKTIFRKLPELPDVKIFRGKFIYINSLILIASVVYFMNDIDFVSSMKSFTSPQEDLFATHYRGPNVDLIRPKEPKNLILIYVESYESLYANEELFGENLIKPLTDLQKNKSSLSFDKFIQMPGASFTMAGIVSTQCGFPLKPVSLYEGNLQGNKVNTFLPGAVCLGDVLKRNSYKNVFLRGASLKFAGANKFFEEHGYTDTYGKEEWLKKGYQKAHMNEWGLFDDDLFHEARIKLTDLMGQDQRFNLTLLTLDMHPPHGFMSKKCAREGDKGYGGVVKCTARQVAEFVEFIDDKGWSDDVNIVIIGDHFSFKNPFYKTVKSQDRSIYNLFIANELPRKSRENINHFDLFPLILEFIGFDLEEKQLGLGISAFGNQPAPLSSEWNDIVFEASRNTSAYYRQLWLAEQTEGKL